MLQRILLILAFLAGVLAVVLTHTKLKTHVQGIIAERDQNAAERDQQRSRANKAERDLNATSNQLVRTVATLKDTEQKLETAKNEATRARDDLDRTRKELETAQNAEKAARQQLAQWDALGVKPEEVRTMREDLGKARETIAVFEEEKRILARQVAKLTNELAKFISPEDYEVPLPRGLKGKILVVDPKWEFVVLNIGENQGVLRDGVMMVHRDSKLVGKVRITNVMADRCVANILPGWKLDDIREGDEVLF